MLEKLYNFDNLKSTELPCPAVVKSDRRAGRERIKRARNEGASRMERTSR